MGSVTEGAFSSAELYEKFGSRRLSMDVADIGTNIKPRYESEEEEVSEAEVSERTEYLFSPIENDSDTGVSEFEEVGFDSPQSSIANKNYASEITFSLEIPIPPFTVTDISGSRSTSTANRDSCITLMPPLKSHATETASISSPKSISASPTLFPVAEPIFVSNHVTEEEAMQYFQSFCSEVVPSDEECSADTCFHVATPISFHVPESKPHLISIQAQSHPPSIAQNTPRQRKRNSPPVTGEVSSESSPGSNVSLKNGISSLRMGKQDKKRDSSLPVSEPASFIKAKFSDASVSALSDLNMRGRNSHFFGSESELSSPASRSKSRDVKPLLLQKHILLPSPHILERNPSKQRHQTIENYVAERVNSERSSKGTEDRKSRKITRKTNPPPVPQLTGIAISSDVPSPPSGTVSLHRPGSIQLQNQQLMSKTSISEKGTYSHYHNSVKININPSPPLINAADSSSNFPFPDVFNSNLLHPTSKRSGFHEKTHSINSLASVNSMPNYPSSDNSSPHSPAHRYRQRFYPTDPLRSERPQSRESINSSLKPHRRSAYTYIPRGSMSTTNLSSMSFVSTSSSRPSSRSDANSLNWNYNTGTWSPSGNSRMNTDCAINTARPRSTTIKRLYETGETVSRAGTKAITGLGAMLRKKSGTPGDERWSSNRFI
ncbi:hypothetical protein PAAG_07249 [Paracoccidioides lutzii Pb01]|uniref:Uncharacterized protein n=1 Tax=Paracoccidioides lutzii (strain ATCC MYA-826 / Pb01) TaxID=502779 RepID=C1H908_PARBA|nr:hypothetical protein PAAG_07249 [Paracoccidioides lutzii Pb01]EEH36831.1 hypothetical protein PAAG_07249 [Paracoccidioides lutzii Pb01]